MARTSHSTRRNRREEPRTRRAASTTCARATRPSTGSVSGGRSRSSTAHDSRGRRASAPLSSAAVARSHGLDELAHREDLVRLVLRHPHPEALLELGEQLHALHGIEAEVELEVGVGPHARRALEPRRDHAAAAAARGARRATPIRGRQQRPPRLPAVACRDLSATRAACRFTLPVVVRGSGSNQTS